MVIKGMTYDEKKTAGERLILACMELPNTEEQLVGSYRGFELSLRFDTFHKEHQALLKGKLKYPVSLSSDPHGNIVRLDNALSSFADRITAAENELDTLKQQQAAAQVEVAKPFPQEEELAQKSARLAELNAQLDVDEKHHEPEQDEEEKEDAPRRSVLAALEEKAEKAEPVNLFKSYLDKDGDARMKKNGMEVIILRLTKTEKHCIYEKMLGMGIRSLSAYIRKMALDGYCLHLDLKELRRMAYLLQMCSNNLNQYAKCANESGQVYAADLEDLRTRFDELISIGKQILSRLADL